MSWLLVTGELSELSIFLWSYTSSASVVGVTARGVSPYIPSCACACARALHPVREERPSIASMTKNGIISCPNREGEEEGLFQESTFKLFQPRHNSSRRASGISSLLGGHPPSASDGPFLGVNCCHLGLGSKHGVTWNRCCSFCVYLQ